MNGITRTKSVILHGRSFGICEACHDNTLYTMDSDVLFSEVAGIEVSSFDGLPEPFVAKTIPGGRYAVFTHKGTLTKLPQTFDYIWGIESIEENTIVEPNFVCTETHRTFFKEKIGKNFSFNMAFQQWLKNNAGKTYAEAIDAYHLIMEEKKQGKTTIDRQFEYNTYIRAFFEDNKGRTLQDAIRCWKYKKGLPGHNRYEKEDITALSLGQAKSNDLKA